MGCNHKPMGVCSQALAGGEPHSVCQLRAYIIFLLHIVLIKNDSINQLQKRSTLTKVPAKK